MAAPDQIVFGLYVFGMIGIALVFANKNTSVNAMFGASGRAPWWVAGLSAFMTMFSAGSFVVWGGLAYREGAVAISVLMALGVSGLVVAIWVAPRWKALKVENASDFIRQRFGPAVMNYFAWMLLVVRVVSSGVALYALAVMLAPILFDAGAAGDGAVSWIILVLGAVVVIYTMLGGLWAVLMTDVLQFIIFSIAVVFTLSVAIANAGGASAVMQALPDGFLQPLNDEFTATVIFGWILTHIFILGSEWAFVQRHLAVPRGADARRAMYLFSALYLASPIVWLAPAIIYRSMNPDANPEQAYILISAATLPIGLLGLMAAAMFSATASMLSSQINVFSGMLVHDAFLKLRPNASEGARLWAGRGAAVGLGALIVVLALLIPSLGGAENVVFILASLLISPLFAAALWGLFSRRINARAVWAVGLFAAGGILMKFGLHLELVYTFPSLHGMADWVQQNPRLTDALVGVFMPLVVLATFECIGRLKRRTSTNTAYPITFLESDIAAPAADIFLPLLIVAVGAALCSGTLFALIFVNPDDAAGLTLAGLCLAAFAAAMLPAIRQQRGVRSPGGRTFNADTASRKERRAKARVAGSQ